MNNKIDFMNSLSDNNKIIVLSAPDTARFTDTSFIIRMIQFQRDMLRTSHTILSDKYKMA